MEWGTKVAIGGLIGTGLVVTIAAASVNDTPPDILRSNSIGAEAVRALIRDASFAEPGPATTIHSRDGMPRAMASLAPLEVPVNDSATMAAGVIVAKIWADRTYEAGGLVAGDNYLWFDGQGRREQPWRAIMLSADGNTRRLIGTVQYMADAAHPTTDSPALHAERYCDRKQGCFVKQVVAAVSNGKPIAVGSTWVRCMHGCCHMEID